jgi:glycosyltransferase involved in cell wall biosynthesis
MVPVTLITDRFGPGTGTGGVVYAVASLLRDRGLEVEVAARRIDAPLAGVRVRPRTDEVPGRCRVAFDRAPGAEVVRASGGVHEAWTSIGADTLWRRLRSASPRERAVERAERASFARALRVVANAEKVARELALLHGVGADRLRLVRTGVDLERFRPDARARAELRRARGVRGRVAVFVGHSWRRKGLDTALAAFRAAAGPTDRLWILGSDARAGAWRRACADPRVSFLGPVDPARWLPAADALLSPTRYDAASNVVLEALAAGVPPVVSLADGSSEIVSERRLCVPDPRSVQGFAEGLRLAWEDGDLRGRSRADGERWPVSRMVDGLAQVIDECARSGRMDERTGGAGRG